MPRGSILKVGGYTDWGDCHNTKQTQRARSPPYHQPNKSDDLDYHLSGHLSNAHAWESIREREAVPR